VFEFVGDITIVLPRCC